jgi:hypothetical protein
MRQLQKEYDNSCTFRKQMSHGDAEEKSMNSSWRKFEGTFCNDDCYFYTMIICDYIQQAPLFLYNDNL